ncbi:MAG: RyR domain-containing protein [Armatimonadota bacterium]
MASEGYVRPVVVTGDVTIDWNLARLTGDADTTFRWNPDDTARVCFQRCGAALLADLIEAVCRERDGEADVRTCARPTRRIRPGDPRYHHSYATWAPYGDGEGAAGVWRVASFLGLDQAREEPELGADDPRRVENDLPAPALVVLDDAALGFRDTPELWPSAVTSGEYGGWTLVKMARPVATGSLWEHLLAARADRLVAVTTISDLRRTQVQISEGVSWERTAQDLFWELTHNPDVSSLSECAHVVVSMHAEGALVLSRTDGQIAPSWRCRLIFDPMVVEGGWRRGYDGGMVGYTTCLAASLAGQLVGGEPDVEAGVRAGISAMRLLHREGYGRQPAAGDLVEPSFPLGEIAREILSPRERLSATDVQDPGRYLGLAEGTGGARRARGFWTILDDVCAGPDAICGDFEGPLSRTAERIVRDGVESALEDVPICRIGHLTTVDRREAEGYRRIRRLIEQYCRSRQSKPLAIGVFGPPGSGKSFGVTQVAQSVGEAEIEPIEFNLSQFESREDLVGALHQVRDIGLGGEVPLVFWDEFDTPLDGRRLGWLPHFLSPIQDGAFRDGQITHHIGRAIFVFAGGTCSTMAEFDCGRGDDSFVQAKGPDFVSRLRGYVNIMGPNQQGADDPHYLLRRAILLGALIQRHAPQLVASEDGTDRLHIDDGVLRAFLHAHEYAHGVRSMEAIIAMSALAGRTNYERSCLPEASQLDLHVDGEEFLALVQLLLFGEDQSEYSEREKHLLERLAAATHEVYSEAVDGYYGEPADGSRSYDELSEDKRELNRAFVRHILHKLTSIGYQMKPARSDDPPFGFPGEHLEYLADMEHERWLRQKLEQGWRWGQERDDQAKINPYMVPWERLTEQQMRQRYGDDAARVGPGPLPEEVREWDRDMVRGIPRVLARAGYTLVPLRRVGSEESDPDDQ